MAFPIDNATIRAALERLGWGEPEPGVLHVFGVRGARPWPEAPDDGKYYLQVTDQAFDNWNDTLGLFGTAFGTWLGTTDPGSTYTWDPMNPIGAAHLVPGWYDYQRGSHKGHGALVQAGPVTVIRDEDRDGTGEPQEYRESGWFGLNIHAGGDAERVGAYSAGCQVFQDGWSGPEWTRFCDLIDEADQERYRYWLFEAADLAPSE